MSEPYLTPEEVEQTLKAMGESWFSKAEVATLRAYAEVVEAVADTNPVAYYEGRCVYCDAWEGNGHKPDCPYPLARELRGHAE